jgi:hypothetical protein
MDSSLHGSSLSSTSFNQKYNEYYDGYPPPTPNIDGIGSSCSSFISQSSFEIHASGDELFGTNSNQSSIGSNASLKFAPVEVNTVQKPVVGLLSYQENLESSDKHCIGQSPNSDSGMFTSSSSFLKRLVIRSSFDRAASGQLGSPQTTVKTIWIWTMNKDVFTTSV